MKCWPVAFAAIAGYHENLERFESHNTASAICLGGLKVQESALLEGTRATRKATTEPAFQVFERPEVRLQALKRRTIETALQLCVTKVAHHEHRGPNLDRLKSVDSWRLNSGSDLRSPDEQMPLMDVSTTVLIQRA